ncbi:MAG: hypothetical protein ACRD72_23290 [Candidatus Angelobacter sp.]
MAAMSVMEDVIRVPEARYAYYRRCQVFRRGGVQCKAPAETGSHICHAHAGQLAMAVRRERERRAVLTEAVAQMRKRGRPECQIADLFMDFKGINVTLAVMMQAVIDGRIDCKTAGRLVVQLQTVSKLLWMLHRKGREGRKEKRISPQVCADERRLKTRTTPLINTDGTDLKRSENQNLTAEARRRGEKPNKEKNWAAIRLTSEERERTRIALVTEVLAIANGRGWAHAPPELLRAA